MKSKKVLKLIGIEKIRELDYLEINTIIMNFVKTLKETFPNQSIDAKQIISKLYECEMYLASFPSNLGTANYFYQDKYIYFRKDVDLSNLDEYMIHELIHCLQDIRDKKGELSRMGLCHFGEVKVKGMAINEAGIEYISSKMLKKETASISYCGIELNTTSKNYYPLLSNLIKQIVNLLGEEELVKSILFSTNDFIYQFIDVAGERPVLEILNSFDLLLDEKRKIFSIQDENKRKEQEKETKNAYEKLQNQILTAYFDGYISIMKNVEIAEQIKNKIEEHKNFLGNVDNFEFYEKYKNKMLEKLDKKVEEINKKNSKNMLMIINNNNKLFGFFRTIRKMFYTEKNENEN